MSLKNTGIFLCSLNPFPTIYYHDNRQSHLPQSQFTTLDDAYLLTAKMFAHVITGLLATCENTKCGQKARKSKMIVATSLMLLSNIEGKDEKLVVGREAIDKCKDIKNLAPSDLEDYVLPPHTYQEFII